MVTRAICPDLPPRMSDDVGLNSHPNSHLEAREIWLARSVHDEAREGVVIAKPETDRC